jgi:hypothetical protein
MNQGNAGWKRLVEPDMLIALSAIVVSFCALAVSVIQVQIMREEQRANAWPRVEATVNTGSTFAMKLTNKGFGPAMIRAVTVSVDSTPVPDWSVAFAQLFPGDSTFSVTQAKLTDVVLSPQTEVQILKVREGAQSERLSAQTGRIGMEVCFCSIYEDCWWLRRPSFGTGSGWTFEDVSSCAIDRAQRFSM